MTTVPTSRPVAVGSSSGIKQRQDHKPHLQRLLAYSNLYNTAQWWRRTRTLGTFTLAATAPVIALLVPSTSAMLAAISGGWLVLGRTILTWLEQRATLHAVRVQELYDTELFFLPWNTSLAGRRPVPDDVADAARHIKKDKDYLNWYDIDLGDTPWPGDVLLCQRQSVVWSRRDHRAYGTTIVLTGISWFILGLTIALAQDLTLADYLIKIFLPSAPAFLDSVELGRAHWRHAAAREQVENEIHDLWETYRANPASLTEAECRKIQDEAFRLRLNGPRVPNLFYKLRRAKSAANTAAGTIAIRETAT
jgi:predicted pore-forming effector associated with SMODS systems